MHINSLFLIFFSLMIVSSNPIDNKLVADVYETSAGGNKLTKVSGFTPEKKQFNNQVRSTTKITNNHRFRRIIYRGISVFTKSIK